jgi:hypothetical protein
MEKQSGCNHVKCLNGACGYDFCWECSNSWSNHGNIDLYRCRRDAVSNEQTVGPDVGEALQIYRDDDVFSRFERNQQCQEMIEYVSRMADEGRMHELLPFIDAARECRQIVANGLISLYYYGEQRRSTDADGTASSRASLFELALGELELKVSRFTGLLSLSVSTDLRHLHQRLQDHQGEIESLGKLLQHRMVDMVKLISAKVLS